MDAAHTYLHPDFGPNTGGYPYGIPFKVVTSAHQLVHDQVRLRRAEQ